MVTGFFKAAMWRDKRLMTVTASAAIAVVLSGCGAESDAVVATTTPSSPSSATSTTTAAPTTTEAPLPAPTTQLPPSPPPPEPVQPPQTTYSALGGAYYFSSPDGQFQCGIVTLASRTEAGCQGTTAPVPPRPDDCMISWGNGIRVTNSGPAEFMCSGGAVYTSGGETIDPALNIGQEIVAEGYTCLSAVDGIACTNDETGHGFRIAPDSNETF